jgi:hypothetical protein
LQIPLQPGHRPAEFILLMLPLHESMTFFRIIDGVHIPPFRLQKAHHLLRFFLRHTDVVISLQHEQRSGLVSNPHATAIAIHPTKMASAENRKILRGSERV